MLKLTALVNEFTKARGGRFGSLARLEPLVAHPGIRHFFMVAALQVAVFSATKWPDRDERSGGKKVRKR